MPKVKIEGLEELQKALKENVTMDDVKRVVRQNGGELTDRMQDHAEFKGHYEGKRFVPPTGKTKGSIGLEIIDDGFSAEVKPTTHYSSYLEYGTRRMEAQPFVRPAFNEQKAIFKRDMQKLVK